MTGTLVNTIAVIAGSLLGLLLHHRLPEKLSRIAFQAIGIFTLYLGLAMALKTRQVLIMIFAIVVGAILGELIDLEYRLNRFADLLKCRLKIGTHRFSEGMVTAFLIFCMGSMTVLGAIEAGSGKTPNLYFAKSILDGFASIALAAGLGIGVLFSALPLFLYQTGLTLLARLLNTILNEMITNELTAVGGLILIGLGINLLEIKKLRVLNLLPALVIVIILAVIFLR
ncbi:MAG: DUF554 domain-containing protein [candidate division WOR-3 bacterium]|jgi:uncharacterized membrane protein YqgA involved in biofilm formation